MDQPIFQPANDKLEVLIKQRAEINQIQRDAEILIEACSRLRKIENLAPDYLFTELEKMCYSGSAKTARDVFYELFSEFEGSLFDMAVARLNRQAHELHQLGDLKRATLDQSFIVALPPKENM